MSEACKLSAPVPGANLPARPLKRFVVGFLALGSVAFVITALFSSTVSDAICDGTIAALSVGILAGIVSAFGKKALAYVIALAREIITNPG